MLGIKDICAYFIQNVYFRSIPSSRRIFRVKTILSDLGGVCVLHSEIDYSGYTTSIFRSAYVVATQS